jgi:hypothetical protein
MREKQINEGLKRLIRNNVIWSKKGQSNSEIGRQLSSRHGGYPDTWRIKIIQWEQGHNIPKTISFIRLLYLNSDKSSEYYKNSTIRRMVSDNIFYIHSRLLMTWKKRIRPLSKRKFAEHLHLLFSSIAVVSWENRLYPKQLSKLESVLSLLQIIYGYLSYNPKHDVLLPEENNPYNLASLSEAYKPKYSYIFEILIAAIRDEFK